MSLGNSPILKRLLGAMSYSLGLNNGTSIPLIGLGTYRGEAEQVRQAVKDAIDAGYRHFDCAWFYGNERDVGIAIKEKIKEGTVRRNELFITTKLWNNFHAKHLVKPMLQDSLSKLDLCYVDLFLIHWPMGWKEDAPTLPTKEGKSAYSDIDYLETWEGMEQCAKEGLTKGIGLSNFNSEQLTRILNNCNIKPTVNQVEVNPNLNQKQLIKFCNDRDIQVVGFCPIGRPDKRGVPNFPEPTIFDPEIKKIGEKYGKTPAQVVLNYLIFHLGVGAIPKSVNKSRIEENFNVFDFKLSPEDVKYLDDCNKNQRCSSMADFKDHKYYPFNVEF